MTGISMCLWATVIVVCTCVTLPVYASGQASKGSSGSVAIRIHETNTEASSVAVTVMVKNEPDVSVIPSSYSLGQNYPNPFNASTTIRYDIPFESQVRLEVFDVLGKRIALLVDELQRPGHYTKTWQFEGRSSGILFYRINAGSFQQTRRMVLIK